MEYVYASLLLHSVGKKIDEAGLASTLKATGADVDEARIKAMVASLEGVNIDEAIKSAAVPVVAATAAPTSPGKPEEKVEEKKEEEEALAGLGALFG